MVIMLVGFMAGLILACLDRPKRSLGRDTAKSTPAQKAAVKAAAAREKARAELPYLQRELDDLQYTLKLNRELEKRLFCNPAVASEKRLKAYLNAVKATQATQAKIDRLQCRIDQINLL